MLSSNPRDPPLTSVLLMSLRCTMLVPMNLQLQLPYLAEPQHMCLQLALAPKNFLRTSKLAILSLYWILLQLFSLSWAIVRIGHLAFLKHTRLYFQRPHENNLPTSLVLDTPVLDFLRYHQRSKMFTGLPLGDEIYQGPPGKPIHFTASSRTRSTLNMQVLQTSMLTFTNTLHPSPFLL
ncbi:uncharacterized protein F5147DRAFT_701895 [Suillus discolor]|uniref:Uncharacterized protein n=1 Tax=Suillus discolor TaxID=1912936 RepID=A0A9P7F538_9AGAM|nr:uncharacterized protein F5147DRAFT_701895 [Suillus discolor]KAG2105781.1 hypothetical protein F5147DRAFT_701895 [Suillus discolor]